MKLLYSVPERILGKGPVLSKWQNGTGNYIACCGNSNIVYIYNRHGESVDEISLSSPCSGLDWDKDGDVLAIITKSNLIFLWNSNSQKTTQLDNTMGLKDQLSFVAWAKSSPLLAVGNSKGNLLLYNHHTSRKTPVVGKHTKKIICGTFNDRNLLTLGSEDNTITVSSPEGDTLYSFTCHGEPSEIKFAEMKETERSSEGETTVSAVIGGSNLLLINLNDADNPINLQFQAKYGNIVEYDWFGDGYILIGFSEGFLVSISTHVSEIGQEIFSVQEHKSSLTSLVVSKHFGKAVCAGDSCVKVREIGQLSEVYAILPVDNSERSLGRVNVSDDGQLLAVSTQTGFLSVYLTRLPSLGGAYKTRVAALTSLSEITVTNEIERDKPVTFAVDVEPSLIASGPHHVVVAMNNRAWFYHVQPNNVELVRDREYLATVEDIKLSGNYAAVFFDGKIELHAIETNVSADRESRMFPDAEGSESKLTCMGLTAEYLIFCTNAGHIQYFLTEDWKFVNEYRHSIGIKAIYPEPVGTRLIFVDSKQDAYVYNPVNDAMVKIPDCGGSIKNILWDNYAPERDTFVTIDESAVHAYIYYRDTVEGPFVKLVGSPKLPHGQTPLLLYNGTITCQLPSGSLNSFVLESHHIEGRLSDKGATELEKLLEKMVCLKRWHESWAICDQLNDKESWRKLGNTALYHFDLEFASRVFRQLGDVGMVWSIESVEDTENRNLLAGHLAMFLDKFDEAEKLYLSSSYPVAALEMRRDLLHWDKALQLASRLAPDQIPVVSKEYAQQLEFTGDYTNAQLHYEKGMVKDENQKAHNESCQAGVARMSIRLGDIRRGVAIALEMSNRTLKKDCAMILESMKQYTEAANLYETGGFHDRAATVYARSKNWLKVAELLPQTSSPKLHAQYAKAMEAENKYKLAVDAYKTAREYDNAVRLLLDNLNSPEEAVKIVRESKSVEGAKLVAKFFIKMNDYSTAIQFLVLSQCHDEAYKLAQQHDKMEIYAEITGTEGTEQDYEAMAQYFEKKRNAKLTGKYYYLAGKFPKALDYLISNGEDQESLKLAIDCVGKAGNADLTRKLVDFLMGEIDGIPKDAKYLFRLYMALKMYPEAGKVAIIISREEQNNGQYRLAHDVLCSMYQELRNQRIKIPSEMEHSLMLIHSYLLAKLHIKKNDHLTAARMLIRVCGNISRFPSHTVPILTSAVIECQRTGLKASAFKFAAMLMRPEYRSKIDEKYKKKIEQIVRRPDKTELEEKTSACPFCGSLVVETELSCFNCKNALPYCIATGKHIIKEDFTLCPACHFPAVHSEFVRILQLEDSACTMCGKKVDLTTIEKLEDISEYLKLHNDVQE